MSIFYCDNIDFNPIVLSEEESRHCIKVLRHKKGDIIKVTNGIGRLIDAKITSDHFKKCEVEHVSDIAITSSKKHYIHLAIAPTKNLDRMEWMVEKCCELGIDEISFITCDHSERKVLKLERLERKAISAMKQSKNFVKTKLNSLTELKSFLPSVKEEQKFLAYVDPGNKSNLKSLAAPHTNYCILIGPEGDFSENEVEQAKAASFKIISLGIPTLRTETAGLIACHSLNFINDY